MGLFLFFKICLGLNISIPAILSPLDKQHERPHQLDNASSITLFMHNSLNVVETLVNYNHLIMFVLVYQVNSDYCWQTDKRRGVVLANPTVEWYMPLGLIDVSVLVWMCCRGIGHYQVQQSKESEKSLWYMWAHVTLRDLRIRRRPRYSTCCLNLDLIYID